jgi:hypothetical protein
MQRESRFLAIALAAGICAVTAAAVPLFATAAPPGMQIQYTTTTSVKMPGILRMFGGGGKATSETTIVSQNRKRTDKENTSDIIACDLKRVYHIDNGAKTYSVQTFAEIQAEMQAAMNQMKTQGGSVATPGPKGSPIQGSGGLTLKIDTVNDPNTQQILGMTARHVTETITFTPNGTGDCPNGGSLSMTNDEWYIPNEVTFSCPLPRPNLPAMPAGMPGGRGPAANPCFSKFQLEANGKAHSNDRFALKQDTTMDIGMKLSTHEEVTNYTKQPYNPASFEVPAGYTQVQPPARY